MTLYLQDCDGRKLRFKLEFKNANVREKVFDFDFRYYNPYQGNGEGMSGLYVFKTEDYESNPFDHAISNIQVFQGKIVQSMIVHYKSAHGGEADSYVKIRLLKDEVEFDVFFSRINLIQHPYGQDVTINWQLINSNPEKPGVFYTDANAYKIVKRDLNVPKDYIWNIPANQVKQVAGYIYPVNSGIFIEDTMKE